MEQSAVVMAHSVPRGKCLMLEKTSKSKKCRLLRTRVAGLGRQADVAFSVSNYETKGEKAAWVDNGCLHFLEGVLEGVLA